jgi:hypothetical protein
VELDVEKAARLFDVPLPKAAPDDAEPSRKSVGNGEWNEIPIRSSVHALLIGTAIADPHRYSLCQITDPDLNETQVYVIGEEYQGARIYRIESSRAARSDGSQRIHRRQRPSSLRARCAP